MNGWPIIPLATVILISGKGSNLQAIIKAVAEAELPLDIRAVISNRPTASGLMHAQQAGIATRVLDHDTFSDRQSFDDSLRRLIDSYDPGLVVLAGFMRILSGDFVAHYHGKILNIHPALLPAFPGLNTHQRVLEASVPVHGASVHFVTSDVDGGPVVIQASIPVLAHDSASTLAARVLEQEHVIYPKALRWFAEGRLSLQNEKGNDYAMLDGKKINLLTEQSCS